MKQSQLVQLEPLNPMTTKTIWNKHNLYDCLKDVKLGSSICLYTPEICEDLAPKINKINELKTKKNAIILAHSYVTPDILCTVADFVGDSYGLSKKAKETAAETIVFAAVKFMAETAKLLNPSKKVLIPTTFNGCSLADSITVDDMKKLRNQYPDYTFICYINTTTAIKAYCDMCVTSSNVYDIAEKIPNDKIYFLPDKLMAKNLINELAKRKVNKTIKYWDGSCYVHEEYEPDMIEYLRLKHKKIAVVAHPECKPDIIEKSDMVGSTSQMIEYVKKTDYPAYFLLTECGLTSRLQTDVPNKNLVGTCTMCKYMKANSLDKILKTLEESDTQSEIIIPEETQQKALACVENMFKYSAY